MIAPLFYAVLGGPVLALTYKAVSTSPNAGLPEAAAAGALGVQVGGGLFRQGVAVDLPLIGDPLKPLAAIHIRQAINLMLAALALAAVLFCGIYFWFGQQEEILA